MDSKPTTPDLCTIAAVKIKKPDELLVGEAVFACCLFLTFQKGKLPLFSTILLPRPWTVKAYHKSLSVHIYGVKATYQCCYRDMAVHCYVFESIIVFYTLPLY